ncbi:MAG: ribose-5-phosphate isomerase RpiA [Chlamydiota bacterium]
MTNQTIKEGLGYYAVQFIKQNMIVGLGTGSTASCFIQALAAACQKQLDIQAVASSEQSFFQGKRLGISMLPFDRVDRVDLTVDGADEIDPQHELIKGAGGAHVREKILAHFSDRLIILADETKLVEKLGEKKPLPVEVVSFGASATKTYLDKLCPGCLLRKTEQGSAWKTDNGGMIFDLPLRGKNVSDLHPSIMAIPGVVDTGYFSNMATKVVIGYQNGSISTLR